MSEYKDRRIDVVTIKKLKRFEDGWGSVDCGGSGFNLPGEEWAKLVEGQTYDLELRRYSQIAGMRLTGLDDLGQPHEWLFRRDEEYFEREHRKFVEDSNRKYEELLEQNREDWTQREQALPDWLRERLERFHQNGGHKFDRDGWGYELIICEMAAMFAGSKLEETEALKAYFSEHGVSGNQVDSAKFMAKVHLEEPELDRKVPAGLTPLTGDPYYKGEGVTEP